MAEQCKDRVIHAQFTSFVESNLFNNNNIMIITSLFSSLASIIVSVVVVIM